MKKKYWVFTSHFCCPVCGKDKIYKTPKFTNKPKDRNKREEWVDDYDWCNE